MHILLIHVLIVGSGRLLQLILRFDIGIEKTVKRRAVSCMRIDTVLHIPPQILYHLTEQNAVTLSRRKFICLNQFPTIYAVPHSLCINILVLVLSVAALMFSRTEEPTFAVSSFFGHVISFPKKAYKCSLYYKLYKKAIKKSCVFQHK